MKIALIKTQFTRLLLFPSFLCLDAPLAALGWARLLHHESEYAAGPPPEFAALFFAVWMIYLGDRILDTLRTRSSGSDSAEVPLRHEWARRHLHVLFVLVTIATIGLGWAMTGIGMQTVRSGLGLCLLTGIYFLIFRFSGLHARLPGIAPGKELLIAICFTAGISLAVTEGRPWETPTLLLAGMGLLFAGNCLLISRVEAARDQHEDTAAYFSSSGRLPLLPEMMLLAALVVGIVLGTLGGMGTGSLALILISFGTLVLARSRREAMRPLIQAFADEIHLITWLLPVTFVCLHGFFGE